MALTNAYITLAEMKSALGDISDSRDDTQLELAINAASRQIDRWCGQRFWADTSAVVREFYVDDSDGPVDLWQDDVAGISSTSGLVVKSDSAGTGSWATTLTSGADFLLMPRNAALLSPARPYTSLGFGLSGATNSLLVSYGRPSLQITAKWGWPVVPDEVKQATLLQAAQLFKSRDAVFGVASFGELGALRVRSSMNEIAQGLVDPFRRIPVA